MRRPCFPNSGSHQHGPPLLGRVRTPPRVPRRQRSFAALRLPRPRRPPLRSSLASGLPRCGGLFFTAAPVPPLTGATPETFLPRLPISRLSPEEIRGDPRCLGHPLRACRGLRPRRVRPPLAHLAVRSLLPSGETIPWAPGNMFLSWLPTHGPLARVPTLRRIRYRLRRKARYRPGGLTLRRAGFAPAG